MKFLYQLILKFWIILIVSVGLGQDTGCMDDGFQQWSPNFGSPACNYNQDAIVGGECLYKDCLGNCPVIIDNGIWIENIDYTNKQYDDCGLCTGDEDYVAGSCYDCNEIAYGTAYIDACEHCVGGNTGNSNAFDIGIDTSYLEVAAPLENYRIPINVSNIGLLNSFYMEMDYDSTDIQIIDISNFGNTNNDNYNRTQPFFHYETINDNEKSFNKRVIVDLIYRPVIDCSQYDNQEDCAGVPNGVCFWDHNTDNTGKCEQNQFSTGCDSTDVIFKIKININELETSVVVDTTLISIHDLVINENTLDTNRVWDWDIIISDPQGCNYEGACNTGSEGACEYPGSENWPGCDCEGNEPDDCGDCNGTCFISEGCSCECIEGEEPDCNDDCGGSAYIDYNCNSCVGGNTGRVCVESCPDTENECTGSDSYWDGSDWWNGDAYLDFCEQCIIGSEDIDCFNASFKIYNSDGLEEDDLILKEFKNFYVALQMQNVIDFLEGIIVKLEFDTDILSLDDWSINPNDLDIEGDLTGELGSSYILEGEPLDTTFNSYIELNTNEFYQGNGGNMLFLQFSILGTNGDSTLINYNTIQINEHVMKDINYTSQVIYIGDCNGVFNGEMLLDECGVCDGDGPEEGFDCNGEPLSINESLIPHNFTLSQNYPNPFNPITYIHYSVPNYDFITIDIINISGKIIKTIVHSSQQPGNYEIMWDGTDYYGISVPSGIYFYKMDATEFVAVKKLVLLK